MAAAVCAALALGCAGIQRDFQREFVPGQVKEDSRIHAYQSAAFVQAFSDGHARSWDARLRAVEKDALPLLSSMAKSAYRLELEVVARQNTNARADYEYYDVNAVLVPRSGKGPRFTLPGAQGTDPDVYERALAPAAAAAKVPPEALKRGHFALFALATMAGELNATDDAMRRMAFGLIVLRKKLEAGEQADYLAPLRPAEKSIEDVDVALRVVAEHHANTARWRSEVIAATALVRAYEDPEGRAALEEQLAESRARAQAWPAAHPRPTMEQFGVAVKELKLPTPDAMLEVLDKDGYVAAAVTVAKGVATGSPGATVEGFGKLAPKNSSLRIVADGLGAAMRGDVMATADAVLELGTRDEDVAPIAERLRRAKGAIERVHGGVVAVERATGKPASLGDATRRIEGAQRGAADVLGGAAEGAAAVEP